MLEFNAFLLGDLLRVLREGVSSVTSFDVENR